MKRRLILTVAVALMGAGLFTAAQALRAHFGRRTVAARGWWSLGAPAVPGEPRDQRWQMVFTVEADGSLHGRGKVRGGREKGKGKVIGQVSGHQLSATIVSEEGARLVILNGVTTPAGATGTFVTAAGDAGTWASTEHEIAAPDEADEPGDDDDDDGEA